MEDKFSKKAIQMFSETAGIADSPGAHTDKHGDEEETVSVMEGLQPKQLTRS